VHALLLVIARPRENERRRTEGTEKMTGQSEIVRTLARAFRLAADTLENKQVRAQDMLDSLSPHEAHGQR
jgi:hypothetical protein